jgi:hypothetical protein
MRRLPVACIVALVLFLVLGDPAGSAGGLQVEAFVWQLNKDYPGANPNDSNLPIRTVYLKTHDGTEWMAEYDDHPRAVSGAQSLRQLIETYASQDIRVAAWFVPKGRDVEKQLQMAKQVIDAGVEGLYADVEPFQGFCLEDCTFLARNFWSRLRAERPNAKLGVIYDPRPRWVEAAAIGEWLAHANDALPMCYWESYSGQGAWGEPGGCVEQAYVDLAAIARGRALEYVPVLQGNSTPARFTQAMDAAAGVGSQRVAVWRRGVVPADVWQAVATYVGPIERPCWVTLSDNCLVREASGQDVYVLQGGARFLVLNPAAVGKIGLEGSAVEVAPDRFLDTVPTIPRDGTLLTEEDSPDWQIVYGGARFRMAPQALAEAMGIDVSTLRRVPTGGLLQVPTVPNDYSRFQNWPQNQQFVVIAGQKIELGPARLGMLLASGKSLELYRVPEGSLDHIPNAVMRHGDVSCNTVVDTVDALYGLKHVAGLPHPGICVGASGDADCDADIDAVDSLILLRHLTGLAVDLPAGCGPFGS